MQAQQKTERHHIDVELSIAGIPAGAVITYYRPDRPWRQHTFSGAGPGDCDPPEYEEIEFTIVDRKGYLAPWLERKAEAMCIDLEAHVLEAYHGC